MKTTTIALTAAFLMLISTSAFSQIGLGATSRTSAGIGVRTGAVERLKSNSHSAIHRSTDASARISHNARRRANAAGNELRKEARARRRAEIRAAKRMEANHPRASANAEVRSQTSVNAAGR